MRPRTTGLGIAAALVLAAGCSKNQSTAPALKGPQIIHEMIAAHGGMEEWRNAASVSFTDQWGESSPRMGFVVEQSSRRAYFDIPGTATAGGWDGQRAWSMNWPTPTPVRFLALLNYYFINLPWLTQDPGVILGEPGTGRLHDDPTEYVTVMMTFEPGTGDTPDDYYRLYIHPETKMLRACDYIVTYRALLDAGETSTPEHCLVYDQMTPVEGVTVPSHFTIYEGDRVYAECSISGYSLAKAFDESRMTMPEGAVVDTSTP
ncbi:MAG TPA: hypothetical protein VEC56_05100 [Candidatus Krumholzibacteria bacterium]|nr:hypothetical protein [Candidatus Krumholzibacteria bacterium]